MDAARFDSLTRALIASSTRRRALGALAALGVLPLSLTELTGAAKGKKKPKKVKPNAFGCLNVGQNCRGKDSKCCSGICQGKKPKKGKKDTSKCVAHNTGGCTTDRDLCFNPELALCAPSSVCLTTTGEAGFCASSPNFTHEANCRPCSKDPECEALGFGPGAACVILRTQGVCMMGCEGFNGSTGTACVQPGI